MTDHFLGGIMRKNILACCLIAILIVLSGGCGTKNAAMSSTANNTPSSSTSTTTTDLNSKEKGYIYQSSNEAMFLTWTVDSDNKIVGQLQITDLTNTGIKSSNHPFNGVINGSHLSITISGSVWTDGLANKVFTGTLNGSSQLTLLIPDSSGMMTSFPFNSGNANDFNNIVKSFNNTYAARQNAAQQAAQQQASQEKKQKIINNLADSLGRLQQDASNLSNYDFSGELETMNQHYTKMQDDYTKLKKDASVVPLTDYQLNSVVGYDLNSILEYDLNSVLEYDLNSSIEYDLNSVKGAITNVNNDISNVQSAYQQLNDNDINDSTYTDNNVTSIIKQAQNDIKSANDKISTTQNQANEIFSKGKQLFQAAQKYFSSLTPSN